MRKQLKQFNGERMRFTATVQRFGSKSAYKGPPLPTVLLTNVCLSDTGEQVTDHLWFTKGKSWEPCVIGGMVEFDARVTTYIKGYRGRRDDVYDAPIEMDYKLERPTRVVVKVETTKSADVVMEATNLDVHSG